VKTPNQNGKVFVGMSGGVDSSVSAALLKEQGFDVTGVFIKVWQPDFLDCTWIEDRRDAMRVAAHLDIPFITIDLEEEYKKEVVEYMISEYKGGRTPNPDVMCNKEIKFGAFFDKAKKLGANIIATGHYAQIEERDGRFSLLKGKDMNKDQSYFLWTIPEEKLAKILFPIGHMNKDEVRDVAKKYKLYTALKKDSQGLCFIGKLDMKEFLKNYIPERKGVVLDEDGNEIGIHDGAFYYTIGQRHGFTITNKGTKDLPYFVVSKNLENNTITVSNRPSGSSPQTKVILENTNWIQKPELNKEYEARVRYRQTLMKCELVEERGIWTAIFEKADLFPAGQSLVVYDGEICLGGGVIKS
jgi:tRNA-uridine 2-sulfurtransferase